MSVWRSGPEVIKVSKGTKIRNRYNQVPHLTQDTIGKVTNSQLDTTNESQEVSSFPAGDHKAQINRRAQRHNKHKTEKKTHKIITKEVPPCKTFSCSTHLSTKFMMLINVKMPTMVGILTFLSMINTPSGSFKQEKS